LNSLQANEVRKNEFFKTIAFFEFGILCFWGVIDFVLCKVGHQNHKAVTEEIVCSHRLASTECVLYL